MYFMKPEDPIGNSIISREGPKDAFYHEEHTVKGKPASSENVVMTLCRPRLIIRKVIIELAC